MSKGKKTLANQKDSLLKYYIIIIIASFVLYGKSINNSFNIDDDYVYENHRLVQKGISGIPEIFKSRYHDRDGYYFGYRPLTIAIYAIEYEFFRMNPHTAHFFNIIYYIICCSLLFYVLNYLLKPKLKENSAWYAFLVTLIFTTHAIHSEVVLSLKNREEILSLFFSLVSLLLTIKFFDKRKWYFLTVALISLLLAFLTKESAIVFLAIIPFSIVFFKSDIVVTIIKRQWSIVRLIKNEKIFFYSLILNVILYLIAVPTMELWQGFTLYSHEKDYPINRIIPLLIFIIHYIIIVRKRSKVLQGFRSIRNYFLWAFCVFLFVFSIIDKSYFAHMLVMPILFITLLPSRNLKEIRLFRIQNANKSLIVYVFLITLLATVIVVLAYLLPKQSLQEINAPVHNWQNPIFAEETGFADRLGLVFYSLIYYIKLLIIPYPLRYYYGYAVIPAVSIGNPLAVFSIIFHVALLVYAMSGFNRRSLISYGILFYLIAIVPYSNLFFPFTGVVAERVLFVPSVGFSIVMVYLIYLIIGKNKESVFLKLNRNYSLFLAAIIIIPNSIIAINRNDDWKDRDTLYERDIRHLENSAKANNVYANHIFGKVQHGIKQRVPIKNFENEVRLAVQHYKRAIEVDSTYSEAWHNLGYVYMILYGDDKMAEYHFSKCLENDSTIAAAYLNRGIANYNLGNFNQSVNDFYDYVTKNENYKYKKLDMAYVYSGKSYLEIGDTARAVEYHKMAVENLKQSNLSPAVLRDIRDFFVSVEHFHDAIEMTYREIEITPDNNQLYVDIGNYHLFAGDTINAVKGWERAFEHDRGNFNIAMTLKGWFESQGDLEKAKYYHDAAWEFRMNNPR